MNPNGATQEIEFVFRRLGDSPSGFLGELTGSLPLVMLLVTAAVLVGLLVEFVATYGKPVPKQPVNPATGWVRWFGVIGLCLASFLLEGYGSRLLNFPFSQLAVWLPPFHRCVELGTILLPAFLTLVPVLIYVPALSKESLRHHTPARALLRGFAGTAVFVTLLAFLDRMFLLDVVAKRGDSADSFLGSSTFLSMFWVGLASAVFLFGVLFVFVNYVRDMGWRAPRHWAQLALGLLGLYAALAAGLFAFSLANQEITGERPSNTAMFLAFVCSVPAVIAVAFPFVPKSINAFWGTVLAALRINLYAILAFVFLLPSFQTWERTEKKSRVLLLIDVSPSMTQVSDDIVSDSGKKPQPRIQKVIDFLTDEKVAFLQKLTQQNPVHVYRFGTRLDDETRTIAAADAAWSRAEWEAFATYDFKNWLLKGLSEPGQRSLRESPAFNGEKPGNAEWAMDWLKKPEEDALAVGLSPEDLAKLKENRGKLEKRIDVARAIVLGTNVPDTITTAINRESSNMVQGLIVLTDGRSNLGSDSSYAELKERATREQIPVFTVAVGEDRQTVAITITDIVAPDRAPPDEPFKIVVEADGVNLANQQVEVKLGLFLPSRDPKKDPPDHELTGNLTFQAGDPPHGTVEFVVDPAKLPPELSEDARDGAGPRRKLKEGAWSAVARIAKDKREAFAGKEHVRERTGIQVIKRPLRVLLVTSGPMREYQTIKTMLVREVQENRAELSFLVQNESGLKGEIVQDVPPERLLTRFPSILDTTGMTRVEDKFYNLNEYDLIIAFDPDWSELTEETVKNIQTWVDNLGGGLILVADSHNTYQLARAEANSRLSPLLDILPVVPDDIVVQQVRPIPKTPRRLYFKPTPDSDLLKLADDAGNDDPTAGWERFFTRREKYSKDEDQRKELNPPRGFFSSYPVKQVKPGAQVLAEMADVDEKGDLALRPWLVVTQPARGRTAYMASAEMYRLRAIDPESGPEYHQRFWIKLARYISANRDVKAARGRVLLNKEYLSGSPIRVQARLLSPKGVPYAVGEIDPKFRILPVTPSGDRVEREDPATKQKTRLEFGPYPMKAKKGAGEFDGYYQAEVNADARLFPPGENRYRVVLDVPDSSGDTLEGEFMVRKSDPELDNARPDFANLLNIASEFDSALQARVADPLLREKLLLSLKKEGGKPKLAFQLGDRESLALIPACMKAEERNFRNRGAIVDLWDKPIALTAFNQEIRLLDFELDRSRVFFVLLVLFSSTFGMMVLRGVWEGVSTLLPALASTALAATWVLLQVAAATVPFFLGIVDGWNAVLGLMLTGWLVVICRLNVKPAFIWLGVQALVTGLAFGLFALFADPVFSYHVQIGFVLLALVGLLSAEWLSRKLLRLA